MPEGANRFLTMLAHAAGAVYPAAMATAQQQLSDFLQKYSPDIAKFGRAAIAHMRNRLPGAICHVYDNYNALAVGFSPDPRPSQAQLSIALYPRWVTLFLLHGATVPDPDGLLTGSGSRVRSVRLASMAMLQSSPVDQVVMAAVAQAGWKPVPNAKGKLVIQSVSARQRPRRP